MTEYVKTAVTGALVAVAIALLSLVAFPAQAQVPAWNATGSTTHSAVATAYTTGELFALNTAGNAVASQIAVQGVQPGQQLSLKAVMFSSGTNQPPSVTLWLFSAPPFTTGLVDRSAYVGPYAADLVANSYLGSLTCAAWNKTNDGTAQYFSECSGSSLMINVQPLQSVGKNAVVYVLEEIGGSYTPLASEKHSYFVDVLK